MEDRQVLAEVPSGKVELVFNGVFSTLQFNAECMDVIHLCKGMCCRLRQGFTVLLKEDEIGKYKSEPFRKDQSLQVLQRSEDGQSCTYLDQEKSTCTIHDHSPWMCGAYHCSPGGKGERVEHRDGGWFWSPMNCLQQLADGSVMDIRKIAKVNL